MKKAIVVLSGGQDSTTCLFWAKENGYECHALTFDYGQRHRIEIMAARKVAKLAGVASHEIVTCHGILTGSSPLVSDAELEQYESHEKLPGGLEKTFVPMRNQLFLTIAANRAYTMGTNVVVTGVCQEDSGGYPDCRATFINSFEECCNYGTFTGEPETLPPLNVLTPLVFLSKADAVGLALTFPGCYAALAHTHTAYDGEYPPVGHDHASLLRAKGFEEADVPDPLILRAFMRGSMHLPDTKNYSPEKIEYYMRMI